FHREFIRIASRRKAHLAGLSRPPLHGFSGERLGDLAAQEVGIHSLAPSRARARQDRRTRCRRPAYPTEVPRTTSPIGMGKHLGFEFSCQNVLEHERAVRRTRKALWS